MAARDTVKSTHNCNLEVVASSYVIVNHKKMWNQDGHKEPEIILKK